MKNQKNLSVFLSCLLMGVVYAGSFEEISADDATRIINEPGTVLLDVRTEKEYIDEHIQGATLIPIHKMRKRWKELPSDREAPIVVYCTVGVRSSKVVTFLGKRGYKRVYNLEGGIEAWKTAGQPVVKKGERRNAPE